MRGELAEELEIKKRENKKVISTKEEVLKLEYNRLQGKEEISKDELRSFRFKEDNLYKENEKLIQQIDSLENIYNEQIWSRLNQYIFEYGEKKGFDIVLGTQGGGNLMFGDNEMDITDEVIDFSNRRYENLDN